MNVKPTKLIISVLLLFGLVSSFNPIETNALDYQPKQIGLKRDFAPTKSGIISEYYSVPTDRSVSYQSTPNYNTGDHVGALSQNTLNNALAYVNYYRYIAGVNPTKLRDDYSHYAQASSFVLSTIREISHYPETQYKDKLDASNLSAQVRKDGNIGAGNSNIFYSTGNTTVYTVQDYFMHDSDEWNKNIVGHRQYQLAPSTKEIGFGLSKNPYGETHGATYVSGNNFDNYVPLGTVIAWPSTLQPIESFSKDYRGNYPVFSVQFGYDWNSRTRFNLDNATVQLKYLNENRILNLEHFYKGNAQSFTSSVITFAPSKAHVYKAGDVFEVTINGVTKAGVAYPINYTVEFFSIEDGIGFEDVKPGYWAYDTIMESYNRGIIKGYEDGLFKPGAQVTRAEAVSMLVRSLSVTIPANQSSIFSDLPNNNWATDYVMYAVNNGIVNGYEDGTFRSNNKITRAELAKMVSETYNLSVNTSNIKSFNDISTSHWAYNYIQALASNGVVGGYQDGSYGPNNNATRAEFTKFVINGLAK